LLSKIAQHTLSFTGRYDLAANGNYVGFMNTPEQIATFGPVDIKFIDPVYPLFVVSDYCCPVKKAREAFECLPLLVVLSYHTKNTNEQKYFFYRTADICSTIEIHSP
jgi:hypothetical protein